MDSSRRIPMKANLTQQFVDYERHNEKVWNKENVAPERFEGPVRSNLHGVSPDPIGIDLLQTSNEIHQEELQHRYISHLEPRSTAQILLKNIL